METARKGRGARRGGR